jgi:hypothetical protein
MLDIEALSKLKELWLSDNGRVVPPFALAMAIPEMLAEIKQHRNDLAVAAGECLVPLPEPGSDLAKVCIASRLLRTPSNLEAWPFSVSGYLKQLFERNDFLESFKWDGESLDGFKADGSLEPFGSGEFNEPTRCIWEAVETLLFYTEPKVPPFTFKREKS